MRTPATLFLIIVSICLLNGCDKPANQNNTAGNGGDSTHTHEDGTTHDDHTHDNGHSHNGHGHSHAQGHGAVAGGKEGHLVVKLPYSDNGATIVRAWIGTEDRTQYFVGKGDYAASHDDYDIHAMAPDPLPADAMWWIEIEKPDGTKVVGSAKPMLE